MVARKVVNKSKEILALTVCNFQNWKTERQKFPINEETSFKKEKSLCINYIKCDSKERHAILTTSKWHIV